MALCGRCDLSLCVDSATRPRHRAGRRWRCCSFVGSLPCAIALPIAIARLLEIPANSPAAPRSGRPKPPISPLIRCLGPGFGTFADTGALSPLYDYFGATPAPGCRMWRMAIMAICKFSSPSAASDLRLAMLALIVKPAARLLAARRRASAEIDAVRASSFSICFTIFLESDFLEGDGRQWVAFLIDVRHAAGRLRRRKSRDARSFPSSSRSTTAPPLERALASVLAQSCQDFEIVVVDDGSTDNPPPSWTPVAIRAFVLCGRNNRGGGAARNAGIDLARGRFVAFLDSDDRFLPHHLEAMRALLEHARHGRLCARSSSIAARAAMLQAAARASRRRAHGELSSLRPRLRADHHAGGAAETARRVRYDEPGLGDDKDFAIRLALAGCKFPLAEEPGAICDDITIPTAFRRGAKVRGWSNGSNKCARTSRRAPIMAAAAGPSPRVLRRKRRCAHWRFI